MPKADVDGWSFGTGSRAEVKILSTTAQRLIGASR